MRQSQSSINRFIRKMYKNYIPKENWNSINRESLELKKLSNRVGFSISTFLLTANAAALTLVAVLLFVRQIFHDSGIAYAFRDSNSVPYNLVELVCYLVSMFVAFSLMGFLLKKNPFAVVNMRAIRTPSGIFPAVLISLSFYFVGTLASQGLSYLMGLIGLQPYVPSNGIPTGFAAAFLYILQVCIAAPLCEEFIFRGFILQSLRKFGNAFAIVVSSLLFAMLHGNLVQIPFAFVAGLALAYFAIRLNSIWASVILHALINSISIAAEILTLYFGEAIVNYVYVGFFVVILMLSMLYVALSYRNEKISLPEPENRLSAMPSNIRSWSFFTTPGFLVFASVTLITVLFFIRIA